MRSAMRSSALGPASWVFCVLLVGFVTVIGMQVAAWMVITYAALVFAYLVFYAALYWYFATKAPDNLRSERRDLKTGPDELDPIADE
jgi:hypothetical protein